MTGAFSISLHLFPLNSCHVAFKPGLEGAAVTEGVYSLLMKRVLAMSPFFPLGRKVQKVKSVVSVTLMGPSYTGDCKVGVLPSVV